MGRLKKTWDGAADFYSEFAFCELDDTRAFLEAIGIEEGDTFLDICCGPGRASVVAAQMGADVIGIDNAHKMLEHAWENAAEFGVGDRCDFRLLDWEYVIPGQNLEKADIVFASRCGAIMEVEKLSKLANKKAAVQIFANAPSIPMLLDVIFAGCEMKDERERRLKQEEMPPAGPGMQPGGSGMQPGGPGRPQGGPQGRPERPEPGKKNAVYLTIAQKAFEAGYDPNIRIFPERFRKTFATEEEALEWVCSLRNPAEGQEERIMINLKPFLTPVKDGVEFCIATKASIIWWDVN